MKSKLTHFSCEHCHIEIEASPDLIGEETECPVCGATIRIPDIRDDGVRRHSADEDDPDSMQAMKSRTIRIQLDDL